MANPPQSSPSSPLQGVERFNHERQVVEPFTGVFGWRTIFNALWPLAGWVTTVILVRADTVPLAVGFVLAALFLQAFYMPVHEAVHRTISAGRGHLAWIDRAIGSACAFMLATSFVEHRHVHLLHHTHANGASDPDTLNAKGGPRPILGRVLIGAVLFPLLPLLSAIPGGMRLVPDGLRSRLAEMASYRSPAARRGSNRVAWAYVVILSAASITGFAIEAWLLFYLPMWAGRFWLSMVFGWLPHHPHGEVGRYRDTRIFTFFGSTFLIRGHDHHLLHHLFPRVPHYRLRALWREMGPHLAAQGARIEGAAARQLQISPQ